jgi:protocatechuate 3,4-dioxygenase beta subunit
MSDLDEPTFETTTVPATPTRRDALRAVALGAAALTLPAAACGGTGSGDDDDDDLADARGPDATAADARIHDADFPDATPDCAETEDNLQGPFYLAGAPFRSELNTTGKEGVFIEVRGRVYSRGNAACTPLGGALLDVWHSDDRGDTPSAYSPTADGFFRGRLEAAEDGSYAFSTIIPGHYLNGAQFRPAHIHVKASAAGHALVTTQLYFEGDEFNDIDPFIEAPLIMNVSDHPTVAGGKLSVFDFVLQAS